MFALRQQVAASLARAYASQASAAPLRLFGVSGRYATALYMAAARSSKTAEVEAELDSFAEVLESKAAVSGFLKDPFVHADVKRAALKEGLTKVGASALTQNFFAVLADNNRLGNSTSVIAAYKSMMIAERGEVTAKITLAEPMDKAALDALTKSLTSKYLEKGQTLQVTVAEDKTLLGGYIVEMGDRFLDNSLATRLHAMHGVLSGAV
eukprot:c53639_g1_i1.p2 GENE.c53639_g1_i1~~c53639_g1_i1.p2  ORF type:complete len:218 (+),score=51.06 c53639_g1_i1:28-654(+)